MLKIDLEKYWNDGKKLKYFFIANCCLLACGFSSLLVGVWLYCSKNNFIELTPTAYSALSAAGLCVFTGVTIFIIAAVGYLAVIWNNRALLLSYILFICLLILVHGVARTTGFLHKEEARQNLRAHMQRSINTTVVLTKIGREIKLQFTWDHMQRELECCGVDNYTDWYYSVHWPYNLYTPDSCCNPDNFADKESMENCGKLPTDDHILYQDGCFPKFSDWLYHHIILVNYVTSVLFFVEVTLLILGIAVMGVIRRSKYPKNKRPSRREPRESIDETSERIRLNSMDRIADATVEDSMSINSR